MTSSSPCSVASTSSSSSSLSEEEEEKEEEENNKSFMEVVEWKGSAYVLPKIVDADANHLIKEMFFEQTSVAIACSSLDDRDKVEWFGSRFPKLGSMVIQQVHESLSSIYIPEHVSRATTKVNNKKKTMKTTNRTDWCHDSDLFEFQALRLVAENNTSVSQFHFPETINQDDPLPDHLRQQARFLLVRVKINPRILAPECKIKPGEVTVSIRLATDKASRMLAPWITMKLLYDPKRLISTMANHNEGRLPDIGCPKCTIDEKYSETDTAALATRLQSYYYRCHFDVLVQRTNSYFSGQRAVPGPQAPGSPIPTDSVPGPQALGSPIPIDGVPGPQAPEPPIPIDGDEPHDEALEELRKCKQVRWDPTTGMPLEIIPVHDYYLAFVKKLLALPRKKPYPLDVASLFYNNLAPQVQTLIKRHCPKWECPNNPAFDKETHIDAHDRILKVRDAAMQGQQREKAFTQCIHQDIINEMNPIRNVGPAFTAGNRANTNNMMGPSFPTRGNLFNRNMNNTVGFRITQGNLVNINNNMGLGVNRNVNNMGFGITQGNLINCSNNMGLGVTRGNLVSPNHNSYTGIPGNFHYNINNMGRGFSQGNRRNSTGAVASPRPQPPVTPPSPPAPVLPIKRNQDSVVGTPAASATPSSSNKQLADQLRQRQIQLCTSWKKEGFPSLHFALIVCQIVDPSTHVIDRGLRFVALEQEIEHASREMQLQHDRAAKRSRSSQVGDNDDEEDGDAPKRRKSNVSESHQP